jgi:nicotinamide-nucleotide amidase
MIAKAAIITIGDELLIGQVVDTNSAFIAQELNAIGIEVAYRIAVGDNKPAITNALDQAIETVQVVCITGGLGPTADDITKPLMCQYFGGKMIVNEQVLQHVKNIFQKLNRPLLDVNLKQAEVPDCCQVLFNQRGTAPGMLFKKANTHFFCMPGVPHEMKGLMQEAVIPFLIKEYADGFVMHETILTAGLGESFLAEQIKDIEANLPITIKLAYLPNYGLVRLRLTSTGAKEKEVEIKTNLLHYKNLIVERLKENVVALKDIGMAEVVGKLLVEKNKTVATAESCTAGNIAYSLCLIPGASEYFLGAVVAYSYEAKQNILGVQQQTLLKQGAVSEACVIEMLKGAIAVNNTDYGIAVSGIMGPGGGLPDKPVGTVWIAVGSATKQSTQLVQFRFDRLKNIELTTQYALNNLRKFILEENSN